MVSDSTIVALVGIGIIILAIGGMAYFGRLDAEPVRSELCTFEAGLYCDGHAVRRDSIIFRLQNGAEDSLTIKDVRVKEESEPPKHICESAGASIFLSRGEQNDITLDVCEVMNVEPGKMYTYAIDYVYQEGNSDVEIIGHGKMQGTVQ